MKEEDLDAVMLIEQQSFSVPWSRPDMETCITKTSSLYVVAIDGENVVGYCGLWAVVDEGQINHVAVTQQERGKGIGTRLLETLIQEGIKQGLNAYTLEVRISNATAIALYKKMGFQEVGIRKHYYAHPIEDAVIMWKYL